MAANLTRNTLGPKLKLPQDDVSERAETTSFLEGVCWVTGHLREAAMRVGTDKRGLIEVEGKSPIEAVIRMGSPAFAVMFKELAEVLEQEAFKEAHKRYPKFDRTPEPSKAGESTGF